MSSAILNNTRDIEGFVEKDVKVENGLAYNSNCQRRLEIENRRDTILSYPCGSDILHKKQFDGSSSTSSLCTAPLCRQFWKAGKYDDGWSSMSINQNGTSYLHIHPKFLHSNATSHKWVFGALAELVDNSVDEIKNGATFAVLDKTLNSRDGSAALLIQDDGGGMDPDAMMGCLSFGFSDKKLESSIGKYGNGFKTSSMRLGADVIVFSRSTKDRIMTQSIGMLSYTFLMQTGQDRIVVPKVDYQFDLRDSTWKAIQDEQQLNSNLSVLLQWSPYCTLGELLDQCEKIGPHGTRIVIYNLWHDDLGQRELDFETDSEDILISWKSPSAAKPLRVNEMSKHHLANRLHYSFRSYLSILYLEIPENFCILLRGQVVKYHNIALDLKYPEIIQYRPQNAEGSVITSIGFLKEAPNVNIHGFNVYHKNRLILPFWHVVSYSYSRGRGVVGVLEANFIEPTHNKQDFEKTPVFQKLETRLKEMTLEYWDMHCGLIGYQQVKKPRLNPKAPETGQQHASYQPVVLNKLSPFKVNVPFAVAPKKRRTPLQSSHNVYSGAPSKTNYQSSPLRQEKTKIGLVCVEGGTLQKTTDSTKEADQETLNMMLENKRLHTLHGELERADKELDDKITQMTSELREAHRSLELLLERQQSR